MPRPSGVRSGSPPGWHDPDGSGHGSGGGPGSWEGQGPRRRRTRRAAAAWSGCGGAAPSGLMPVGWVRADQCARIVWPGAGVTPRRWAALIDSWAVMRILERRVEVGSIARADGAVVAKGIRGGPAGLGGYRVELKRTGRAFHSRPDPAEKDSDFSPGSPHPWIVARSCRRGRGRCRLSEFPWPHIPAVRPVIVALAPDVPGVVNTTVYVVRE